MAEVAVRKTVLADSAYRTRPNFSTYLMTDSNALGNDVQQSQEKRRIRQMKFPPTTGRRDVDSFQDAGCKDLAFKKWNDNGDFVQPHRAPAPTRSCDNSIDPTCGFVSVGGDFDRQTGHRRIRSMVQLSDTPQSRTPQEQHSIRIMPQSPHAPLETRRLTESDPGFQSPWNSRKLLDGVIRARLGGWTSDKDPRTVDEAKEKPLRGTENLPRSSTEMSKQLRDRLALKYMYTSSTQRGYEEIPWDNMLPPKKWAPTSTLEEKPDMISQRYTLKRYDAGGKEWQAVGTSWDRFQTRDGNYKKGHIVFCSTNPRAQQIPLYGGCVGGVNLDEIDNQHEAFQPLTIKRVNLPRFTDTSHRPNIPKYTGCTLYRREYSPAHHTIPATPMRSTIHDTHREVPVNYSGPEQKRLSNMSKMVTLVPPHNPFNKVPSSQVVS